MTNCFSCSKPLTSKTVRDNDGNSYHPDCFVCGWCSTPLLIDAYYTIDGKTVCQACRNKEKCHSCGFMITESKYVAVDSKVWHPDCFVCDTCYIELPSKFFFEDNKLWCAECINEKGADDPENQCAKCHKLVKSCIKALGKKWHEECFTCTRCSKPFPNDEFVKINGMPYCDPCADLGEVIKTLPADLKGIHTSTGSSGAGGRGGAAAGGAGGRGGAAAGGAGGRGGSTAAGSSAAAGSSSGSGAAGGRGGGAPAPVSRTAAVPPPVPPRDEEDDATAPRGSLGTSTGSKYDATRPGKIGPTAVEKRGTRDYKSKPVLMVGGEADHLNELDNFEFSSSRR